MGMSMRFASLKLHLESPSRAKKGDHTHPFLSSIERMSLKSLMMHHGRELSTAKVRSKSQESFLPFLTIKSGETPNMFIREVDLHINEIL